MAVQTVNTTVARMDLGGNNRCTMIDGENPNTVFIDDDPAFASIPRARWRGPSTEQARMLLYIDATEGIQSGNEPPADAFIISATLRVQTSSTPTATETGNMQVLELTRDDWVDDEVTWNNYATGSAWSDAGGDVNLDNAASFVEDGADNEDRIIDVTRMMRDRWADGKRSLNVLIKPEDESGSVTYGNIYRGAGQANESLRPTLTIEWVHFKVRLVQTRDVVTLESPTPTPVSSTFTLACHNLFYGPGMRRTASTPGGSATSSSIGFAVHQNVVNHLQAIAACYEAAKPDVICVQEWWGSEFFEVDVADAPEWKTLCDKYPYRTGGHFFYPKEAADPNLSAPGDYTLYFAPGANEDGENTGAKDNLSQRVAHLEPGPNNHWWVPDDPEDPTGTGVGLRQESSGGVFPSLTHDIAVMSKFPIVTAEQIEVQNTHSDDRRVKGAIYTEIDKWGRSEHIYTLHINRDTSVDNAHIEAVYPFIAHMLLEHMRDKGLDPAVDDIHICGDINIDRHRPSDYGGRGQIFFETLLANGFNDGWEGVSLANRVTFGSVVTFDYILYSDGFKNRIGGTPNTVLMPGSGANGGEAGTDPGSVSDHIGVLLEMPSEGPTASLSGVCQLFDPDAEDPADRGRIPELQFVAKGDAAAVTIIVSDAGEGAKRLDLTAHDSEGTTIANMDGLPLDGETWREIIDHFLASNGENPIRDYVDVRVRDGLNLDAVAAMEFQQPAQGASVYLLGTTSCTPSTGANQSAAAFPAASSAAFPAAWRQ